jgi:hypothetical protein
MIREAGFVLAVVALVGVSASALASSTFNQEEAKKELTAARGRAADCSRISGVTGAGKLKVSIGNSGQVTEIVMVSVPPKMDEKTDACVRAEFQKLRVTPFEGDTVVVSGGFLLL